MGDRRQAGKPSRYVTSHPGQLSLAISPWVGANEYQRKLGCKQAQPRIRGLAVYTGV